MLAAASKTARSLSPFPPASGNTATILQHSRCFLAALLGPSIYSYSWLQTSIRILLQTVMPSTDTSSKSIMTMALRPVFERTSSSIFDPFSWDTFPSLCLLDSNLASPSRQLHRRASAIADTQVDWKETLDAHIFQVDLPGLKKEEINVELEAGRFLSISGERSKEEIEKLDKWHRMERSHGTFLRKFRLPDNANPDDMTAQVENGVLNIKVPKLQKPKPDVRSIAISG